MQFVDTTFRDGHTSLWAERMPTGMMLAVAELMDRSGYMAMEIISTSHFKTCIRELKEDPFERLDLVAAKLSRTPMAAVCGARPPSTFGVAPQSVVQLYFERLAAHGIRRIQIMEPSNDMVRIAPTVQLARRAGLETVMALVYSVSPRHNNAYYAEKVHEAVRLGVDIIYLKDPAGLITPEQVRVLVPTMLSVAGTLPFEFHSHCTTSLAPMAYLEAVRLGARTIHTAIPPLANGSSQPSLFNILQNLDAVGAATRIDRAKAEAASQHLRHLAKQMGLPSGNPIEYDCAQYLHQVPGGVISNLRHQLESMDAGRRLPEVLAETARVRAELGYPIMVTPFSQFVVSQATLNVLLGERYLEVIDEVINFTLGVYGAEASGGVDPEVRDKILDRPRAEELAGIVLPEPSLSHLRALLGGSGISDDELLLRYMMGGEREVRLMREHGGTDHRFADHLGLAEMLEGLCKYRGIRSVAIDKGGFRLELRQNI